MNVLRLTKAKINSDQPSRFPHPYFCFPKNSFSSCGVLKYCACFIFLLAKRRWLLCKLWEHRFHLRECMWVSFPSPVLWTPSPLHSQWVDYAACIRNCSLDLRCAKLLCIGLSVVSYSLKWKSAIKSLIYGEFIHNKRHTFLELVLPLNV